jgi:hypothetical protein
MASKTADELSPAYGNLQTAVLLMAIRYAEAHADYVVNIGAAGEAYHRCKRAARRRYRALARLTAALANR